MWKSVCCAVQGTGHKKTGVPCQDKTLRMEWNGVHVIALADGAGSARLSHYGAERVVRDVAAYIAEHFQECFDCNDARKVKQELLETLHQGLSAEALQHGYGVKDLASTLLLAAVNEKNFILAHIGDGVIGYLDGDTLKDASTPDNGEFSNVTTFVTSAETLASMRLFKGELKSKDAFVLMSDGTEQSLYHKQSKTLAKVVVKLMHRTSLIAEETMELRLEEDFTSVISKRTQDDCSIAILVRPSATLKPFDLLNFKERKELYGLAESQGCSVHRRVKRYDKILMATKAPCSLKQIARMIHLKPKYAKKHIARLITLGLVARDGNVYRRA